MIVQPKLFNNTQPRNPQQPPVQQEETFSWNPQDRRVMEPTSKVIPGIISNGNHLETSRVKLNDELERQDGRFVFGHDDPRQNTAVAFSAAVNTVNVFKETFGDFAWSFGGEKLGVNANAGQMLNAFYSRWSGAVNFFHNPDPIIGQKTHSGGSGEIVAHEVGHAILDGIRPGYLNAWGPDPGAFHESFGDMLGIHMSLMDPRVIDRVAVQTGGDLSLPNVAALTAEELGIGINHSKGRNHTGGDWLRNANNKFEWQDPATLPEKGDADHLGREAHSFSRLWTGAHFDVLKAMVAQRTAGGQDVKSAISEANRELLGMLANLLKEAPQGEFTYRDMALAFIASDQKYSEGKHGDLLRKVFTDRKILEEGATSRHDPGLGLSGGDKLGTVEVTLDGSCGQYCGAVVEVPVEAGKALLKSTDVQSKCMKDLGQLIKDGKIRYNDPGYRMKPEDCFNPQNEPYIGAVVWEDGKMKIERLPVVT